MYKKVFCTCKIVVLPSKPIFVVVVVVVVFDVLVAVASSDLKVLITNYKCTCQCVGNQFLVFNKNELDFYWLFFIFHQRRSCATK